MSLRTQRVCIILPKSLTRFPRFAPFANHSIDKTSQTAHFVPVRQWENHPKMRSRGRIVILCLCAAVPQEPSTEHGAENEQKAQGDVWVPPYDQHFTNQN